MAAFVGITCYDWKPNANARDDHSGLVFGGGRCLRSSRVIHRLVLGNIPTADRNQLDDGSCPDAVVSDNIHHNVREASAYSLNDTTT